MDLDSGSELDPLQVDGSNNSSNPSVTTVYVTIPQGATVVSAGCKGSQSVIQQAQTSVIQSTNLQGLQTVQIGKGTNVILLKQQGGSVIQTASGGTIQVVEAESNGDDFSHKRQILARRPSYRKILNELGGGEITVIPASALQQLNQGDGIQTIQMTNTSTTGGAIVHYAQGSDGQQFMIPVSGDLSGLKLTSGGLTHGVVLTTGTNHGQDHMAEEATRKREVRLLKNREAARECRAKKKEYIKCLENRVAVLENQNKALIDELKTLKQLDAAQECRRKKKEYVKCLENRVAVLENQNKALIDELRTLKQLYCQKA